MWARVVAKLSPEMLPRASGFQCGAPSPESAGTTTTPPLSITEAASAAVSPACSIIPSPSRSHLIRLPATNTEPSSAYVRLPPSWHSTVPSRRWPERGTSEPMLARTNAPVPYVALVSPGARQPCPIVADC